MKREDIKKPNPEALDKASKLINDLVKKKPSDDFFEKIEKTNNEQSKGTQLPRVASPFNGNSDSAHI